MHNPRTVLVESTDCSGDDDDDECGTFQKCGENKLFLLTK